MSLARPSHRRKNGTTGVTSRNITTDGGSKGEEQRMKYIIIVLTVIVIMHDISIYRLNRKVHILRKFFDEVIRQLEEYASKQTERSE